ncbi:Detected protein of confused Function [Hibiscus syriacus]|uniref:Glycosyltransferase n=1 Tax=Hibiscus syriacus TaxID=106335 RepID=A0A6A3B3G4_HIBSY|nr:UDP-glycosyltransferase 13-like [Hibiscus syriacus]KAE8710187.1 Detected protein of confused Function [Hibiscus syriacus]
MSNSDVIPSHVHVALLPSSGVGHLLPFLRLAASLIRHQCSVTLITTHPVVSSSESQIISTFLSLFPQVTEKKFTLIPIDPTTANTTDPFFLQWETIRRSAHLLFPLLSSSSPLLSFIVTDVTLMTSVISITENLRLPNYCLFTASARMLSLVSCFPSIPSSIPKASLPPALLDSKSFLAKDLSESGKCIKHSDGVLINTFEELEKETLEMLPTKGLPTVFTLGPLLPLEFEGGSSFAPLEWLENQRKSSVVYVSFGSRTAMSKEQIRELGKGLVLSGYKFLWVVKSKIVDKEEIGDDLDEILGHQVMNKVKKNYGFVLNRWVDQWRILSHKAVGGFMSHCGWNSVVEAAWHGIPVLGWPQHGDQMINGEVIEAAGWGLCMKSWGWGLNNHLVKGEEIGDKIKELMENQMVRMKAAGISEAAKKSSESGGSCHNMAKLFQSLNKN